MFLLGILPDYQMTLRNDHFVDRTFWESNWTTDERQLATDQSQFDNAG